LWRRLHSIGGRVQSARALLNPAGLARIRRQQGQAHQPAFPRLPQVCFGLKFLRLGGELIEFFGMHQSVALIAHQGPRREWARAALAVANQFRGDRFKGHSSDSIFYLLIFYL